MMERPSTTRARGRIALLLSVLALTIGRAGHAETLVSGTVVRLEGDRVAVRFEPIEQAAPRAGDRVEFQLMIAGVAAYAGAGSVSEIDGDRLWVTGLDREPVLGSDALIRASGDAEEARAILEELAEAARASAVTGPSVERSGTDQGWAGGQGSVEDESANGWVAGRGAVAEADPCRGLESEIAAAGVLLADGMFFSWSKAVANIVRRGCRNRAVREQYAAAADFADREREKNERVAAAVRANPPRQVDWGGIADQLRASLEAMGYGETRSQDENPDRER